MSRKIFVIVNVGYGAATVARPALLSAASTAMLARASSDHVLVTSEELSQLAGFDVTDKFNVDGDQNHYFKRRAQARRALASVKAGWTDAADYLRIVELGAYERNVRPVKQWQVLGALSLDKGKKFDDYQHLSYHPLRNEARIKKADFLSHDARALTDQPDSVVRWKYKVVPVYAD